VRYRLGTRCTTVSWCLIMRWRGGVAVDVVLKHIGVLSMLREVDGKNGKEFTMRSTFVTTAMENGASLEAVQLAAGQAYHVTTKLYDRRGYDPEKLVSFFANY
jgi:hypothetical protein